MATSLLETEFTVGCEDYENDLHQIINRKILDPNFEPNCGCDCAFFSGKRIGLKLYREERIRNNAMFHQKLMHGFGLAPEVFEPINVMRKGELKFGYVTEMCEAGLTKEDLDLNEALRLEKDVENCLGRTTNWTDDISSERSQSDFIGCYYFYLNIGRVGERFVVIDFATNESDEELGELAFGLPS